MEPPAIPLFSLAALAILDRQPYDATAKGQYEWLSGSLIWGDEFPAVGTSEGVAVREGDAHRFLIAFRADLTLGTPREAFRPVWDQVVAHAPNWPGLRPERRGEKARHRLLAAKRIQEVCFAEWERKLAENPVG